MKLNTTEVNCLLRVLAEFLKDKKTSKYDFSYYQELYLKIFNNRYPQIKKKLEYIDYLTDK